MNRKSFIIAIRANNKNKNAPRGERSSKLGASVGLITASASATAAAAVSTGAALQ